MPLKKERKRSKKWCFFGDHFRNEVGGDVNEVSVHIKKATKLVDHGTISK